MKKLSVHATMAEFVLVLWRHARSVPQRRRSGASATMLLLEPCALDVLEKRHAIRCLMMVAAAVAARDTVFRSRYASLCFRNE